MNQGEIRVMAEDLLDWVFDKGERHGKEVVAHQEAQMAERMKTSDEHVRVLQLQSQLDTANAKLREVQSA